MEKKNKFMITEMTFDLYGKKKGLFLLKHQQGVYILTYLLICKFLFYFFQITLNTSHIFIYAYYLYIHIVCIKCACFLEKNYKHFKRHFQTYSCFYYEKVNNCKK